MEDENMSYIDVREMALKCSTKAEVYKVLTITGNIYLPPVDQINSDFIRDILCGDKHFVSGDEVKFINVPHIEGLRIPELLDFARLHCDINKYMPEYDSEKFPSRKWICNISMLTMLILKIVNSLTHDKFSKFVNDRIVECNNKIVERRGNKFPVLNTMAKMLKETTLVSKRKGRFHQLIKSSKMKRNERDLKLNEESKEKEFKDHIRRQKDEIEDLQSELNEYKSKYEDRQKDTDILQKLYESGYINSDGDPTDIR